MPVDVDALVRTGTGLLLGLDGDDVIRSASPRAQEAFGADLPGRTWAEAFPPLAPGHPLHPYGIGTDAPAAVLTRCGERVIAWLEVARDAGLRAVLGHEVAGMARGAERLQESERKYRRLVEGLSAEYFFYRHGPDGIFTYVSPSVQTVLGYPPAQFLVHYADFFIDDPVNAEAQRHTELSSRGIPQPAYPVIVRHADGTPRHLEVLEVPVRDAAGTVAAIEGLAHDVTERVRAEVRRTELLADLERLDREKNAILALVAHDLRSPLTAIRGWAEAAQLLGASPGVATALERIVERTGTLAALVDRILAEQTLNEGRLALQPAAQDLGRTCRAVVEDHALSATAKGIALVLEEPPPLPPAWVDAQALREVVDNLVSNGIKYAPRGGRVRLTLSSAGARVALAVTDDGPGLSPEDQERLFQPFARLGPRPTGGEASAGLGLSIVRRLVGLMGGTVRYEGGPGRGSTFVVELPAGNP